MNDWTYGQSRQPNSGTSHLRKRPLLADPLTKTLWVIRSRDISALVRDLSHFQDNLNSRSPGTLRLQINVDLSVAEPGCLEHVGAALSAIQELSAATERTQPKICVSARHDLVTDSFVHSVAQADSYTPRIEVHLTVNMPETSESLPIRNLRDTLHRLHDKHILSRFLLLSDTSKAALAAMQTGRTSDMISALQEISSGTPDPYFEIPIPPASRHLAAFVEPLLRLLRSHPTSTDTSANSHCGLVALLTRAIRVRQLTSDGVPLPPPTLFCCGAALTSAYFPPSAVCHLMACPYQDRQRATLPDNVEDCMACGFLHYCSACYAGHTESGECRIRDCYSALQHLSSQSPSVIDDLLQRKNETPVLEHDWDYIYDPFSAV